MILVNPINSTTVIAKIKGMPRSLFYVIPRYVTMDYDKLYTSLLLTQYEEIRAFEVQDHVEYMSISRFRCGVDLVYFVLACKKFRRSNAVPS